MVSPKTPGMSLELRDVRLPLPHFTLQVNAVIDGAATAIFGPSGSGKTTLLEIIAGLRRPAAGVVRVGDAVLTDTAAQRFVRADRRAIGYVPQDGALFPHLSVRDNLRYGFDARRARPAAIEFDHVIDVLEIGALIERSIDKLSGGEKQRVALGRALLAAPRLLLLDEPLASLDLALKERVLPYLHRLRDEFQIPLIYVTHSPDEVVALCDDVLVLVRGRIAKRGRPAELFVPAEKPHYRQRHDRSDD
jgi:molybdate transport system ATP-binding protein